MKQTINLMSEKRDVSNVRGMIDEMRISGLFGDISQLKYGTIGDKVLINLSVEEEHLNRIVKHMISKEMNVLTFKNENLKEIISQSKKELGKQPEKFAAEDYQEFLDKKPGLKKPAVSIDQLELMAEKGNYKEILRISRDVINYNSQVIERAKAVLSSSITAAIDRLFSKAAASKNSSEECINEIIAIVSDQNIRSLKNSLGIIKDAGMKIIDLCRLHTGFVADLVDLSGNKNMHNLINIKAAVAFGEIVLKNPELHKEAIEYAIKYLNTKWLYTAYDVAEPELTREEKITFERIISFIAGRRK